MARHTPLWLAQGSYAAPDDRLLVAAMYPVASIRGCTVSKGTNPMDANVAVGSVAVPTANATGTALCASDAVEIVTLTAAPPSGNDRCDLIICQVRANDLDGGANNDFIFTRVTGAPYVPPFVAGNQPATPANAVALARIIVNGGSAAINPANITDLRPTQQPLSLPPTNAPWPGSPPTNAPWPTPSPNPNAGRGLVGITKTNDNQSRSSTSFANAVDLAPTTFNAVSGRYYRGRVVCSSVTCAYSTGNGVFNLALSLDGAQWSEAFQIPTKITGLGIAVIAEIVGWLTDGSHTVAMRGWGGGSVNSWNFNGTTQIVTVEDLGTTN
jgi:hypothetical protein